MEFNAASGTTPPQDVVWVGVLKNLWQRVRSTASSRRARRLRVCETLSLGERRFVAVIEFDRQEFLVGGSGSSLSLLARLKDGTVVEEMAHSSMIDGIPRTGARNNVPSTFSAATLKNLS